MNVDECRPGVEVVLGEHTHRQGWGAGMDSLVGTKTRLVRRCHDVGKPAWYVEGNDFYWHVSNMICVDTEPTEEVVLSATRVHEILESHRHWLTNDIIGRQADLRRVNLSGFDLSNRSLSEAILCNANLSGANLHKANLLNAHLEGVDFTGANLSDAILHQANFTGSVLVKANFRGSVFQRNTFDSVDLRGADFSESKLESCLFCNCNLELAKFNWATIKGDVTLYNNKIYSASFFEAKVAQRFVEQLRKNSSLGFASVDLRGARYEY